MRTELQDGMTPTGWFGLIEHEKRRLGHAYLPTAPKARTLIGMKRGLSQPAIVRCDNKQQYVVKCPVASDHSVANDQVIARLATLLQAPTGIPALVHLSDEFIDANPPIAHFQAGYAHATIYIPDLIDTNYIVYEREPENRQRYSRLAVLYGWLRAADRQLCYEAAAPNLIWSLDHHRFLGGERWTAMSVLDMSDCFPDQWIQRNAGLSASELANIASRLPSVDLQTIAQAVAFPPDDWAITMDERIALAECILLRRDHMVAFMSRDEKEEGG
jgi:hypothetical protein